MLLRKGAKSMEKLSDFATRLTAVRLAYGRLSGRPDLSRAVFAAELGVERETYRRWERGETSPPIPVLAQIRELTGISLDFLIAGSRHGFEDPNAIEVECTATFAERLQWAREIFGASAAELASKMQVPLSTYLRWETGRETMPKDKLEEFAHSFSVTVQYLENGSPEGLRGQVLRQLRAAHPGLWQAVHTDTAKDVYTTDHAVETLPD